MSNLKEYLLELFYVLTGALIIFTAMEMIHHGIVLAYVNMNYLLLFWLIIGIVIVASEKKTKDVNLK